MQYPQWIQLDVDDIKESIKLRVTPQVKDIGKKYTLFFILTDSNASKPKSSKFEVLILVVDPSEKLDKYRIKKKIEEEEVELRKEKNIIVIEPVDSSSTFRIEFSKPVRMASNCTQWSN